MSAGRLRRGAEACAKLTDGYAAERGFAVFQAEVDAYAARQRQVLAADPNVGTTPDHAESRAAREQAARAYLLQRRIDDARWNFLPEGSEAAARAFDMPTAP